MKNAVVAGGIAIIVIANAVALMHAARNRTGSTDAELTLTNRELSYFRSASDDDSGVTLRLRWTTPGDSFSLYGNGSPKWLDRQKLERLGFDCSVNPPEKEAVRFYQRQRPRQAFVALEFDGPAWQAWLDEYHREMEQARQQAPTPSMRQDSSGDASRLVLIDADVNGGALRARHPDLSSVVIVPAVISLGLVPYADAGRRPERVAQRRVEGRIDQLASAIHVPRPFSDEFLRGSRQRSNSVRVRYGRLFEPWVTGVDFVK
jgi:hypothetical protein